MNKQDPGQPEKKGPPPQQGQSHSHSHSHSHGPGHSHSHEHDHGHEHQHEHGHQHGHGHEHQHGHEHGQEHRHDHGHSHQQHQHGQHQQHQHGQPPKDAAKERQHPHDPHAKDARHSHEEHKSHWLTWVILIVVLALCVVGVMALLHKKAPKQPAMPPVAITVTNAQMGDIPVAVTALGSVQPVYTVSLSPRVDGQIISVNYTEGQMVNSNDLLIVIDPAPYQAQETAAEGQLARDEAVLEGAKIDLTRYQTALQKNAIPKQQYDDQVALVHQDEGVVKVDQGNLENAKVQLNYCSVRAPVSGRVGLRLVDPGNVVHAANTNAMVVIAQLQPITAVFGVAEDYLPQMQAQLKLGTGMKVEAYDRAQEAKIAEGDFLTFDNLIDTSTGTVKVKSVFSNEDDSLFPNQFVNARLIIKMLHDVTLIPTFAVQRNPEGTFVYVLTNGNVTLTNTNGVVITTNITKTSMRNIKLGIVDGNTTQVTNGLQPGETIALDNFNKLGEGTAVRVRKPGNDNNQGTNSSPQGGKGEKSGGGHKKKSKDAPAKDGGA